jgi:DNA polymerase
MARRGSARTAAGLIPERASLSTLREIAARCRACPLWERGTQTVFGEGAPRARVVLVGEQPGNDEDLAGRPFVGPAGKLLDRALEQAGIERRDVYVTNVVKHFKWEPKGKRRIHARPNAGEIRACFPWLEAELARLEPEVVVALGATAAQALCGSGFKVTQRRGELVESAHGRVMATVHPSAILRAPDEATRHEEMERFVDDLSAVTRLLRRAAA